MENNIDKILLYETYGKMLTKNMQDVFEQYYFSDLSLREIGENNKVSFQAVRDTLKKAERQLLELEKNIGMLKLKKEIMKLHEYVQNPNMDVEELKKKINKIGE